MKSHRHYWVLAALTSVVLGVAAVAAAIPIGSDSKEQVYVIPSGTWARRAAGEPIAVLPSEIRLTLDIRDILVLRNQDVVPQMFGPVLIMPGQSFELPFRVASTYLFACTFHVSGQLSVVVVPKPVSGWARLQWWAGELTKPSASI